LIAQRLQHDALQLRGLARSLHAISPLATVARGYSILQQPNGHVVRRLNDANLGDTLHARLQDGALQVQVVAKQSPGSARP
jgi:exodeoxyribonuclease VII large subunit